MAHSNASRVQEFIGDPVSAEAPLARDIAELWRQISTALR